ncbi:MULTISPECIES: hypothetical protein [unclassified Leptolyngbya]|uniref:hypothetical protein n=1 Tax=unclassified Leptolyngbya TaxID=2650499 RepID=UPI003D321EE0
MNALNLLANLLTRLTIHAAFQHDRDVERKLFDMRNPSRRSRNHCVIVSITIVVRDVNFQHPIWGEVQDLQFLSKSNAWIC